MISDLISSKTMILIDFTSMQCNMSTNTQGHTATIRLAGGGMGGGGRKGAEWPKTENSEISAARRTRFSWSFRRWWYRFQLEFVGCSVTSDSIQLTNSRA